MNVGVVGTGYVGLVAGTCFAESGNDVVCVDIDEAKIALLKQGKIPIYEPGLEEVVERNVRAGRLHFTTSYKDGLKDTEFVFVAVNTPPGLAGEAEVLVDSLFFANGVAIDERNGHLGGQMDHPVLRRLALEDCLPRSLAVVHAGARPADLDGDPPVASVQVAIGRAHREGPRSRVGVQRAGAEAKEHAWVLRRLRPEAIGVAAQIGRRHAPAVTELLLHGGEIIPADARVVEDHDLRTVNIDFNPTYFAEEYHLMGRLEQGFGEGSTGEFLVSDPGVDAISSSFSMPLRNCL